MLIGCEIKWKQLYQDVFDGNELFVKVNLFYLSFFIINFSEGYPLKVNGFWSQKMMFITKNIINSINASFFVCFTAFGCKHILYQ